MSINTPINQVLVTVLCSSTRDGPLFSLLPLFCVLYFRGFLCLTESRLVSEDDYTPGQKDTVDIRSSGINSETMPC